jgi:hypothetical protein
MGVWGGGGRRGVGRVLVGKLEGKRQPKRSRHRWEVYYENFRKCDVWARTGSMWLKIGQVACICECGNEPSGSIKCGEVLD